MKKWTRAFYQPAIGLGKNNGRVTGCKEHIALSRRAATEGMVLLKNENNVLPLKTGSRVALFGKGCIDYVKGGGGSGDVTVAYTRNLYQGLKEYEKEGKVQVFEPLCKYYEKDVQAQYEDGAVPGMTKEPKLPEELLKQATAFTDTAIICICRYSGEAWDRKLGDEKIPLDTWIEDVMNRSNAIFDRGDFYLTKEETQMVEAVTKSFSKVVVVMNVGGMVDTSWFADNKAVSSVLMAWQGGMEGGLAQADVLLGMVTPSGHLTDTFAKDIHDYPSTDNFHENLGYVEYTEDIYVGYRYFETIPGAPQVNYPFGYGLSYTDFEIEQIHATSELFDTVVEELCREQEKSRKTCATLSEEDKKTDVDAREELDSKEIDVDDSEICMDQIYVDAIVTNTGNYNGKEVLQLYYEAPQGLLGKPKKVLGAFVKTNLLNVGQSQRVRLTLPVSRMASYDDTGKVAKSCYVLEKGAYKIHLGINVRDTVEVFSYEIPENIIVEKCSEKCRPSKLSKRMRADGSYEEITTEAYPKDVCAMERLPIDELEGVMPDIKAEPLKQAFKVTEKQFMEVADGKMTLEAFMDRLSIDDLIELTCGHRGTGVTNTGSMGSMLRYGIPAINTADGPAGLRILDECCIYTTAFPCATMLACSFDTDLVKEVGRAGASEVKENNIGIWLTPAVNIHRSPLCGRNFEYYSEDPYLSGEIGAAMVEGIQSVHVGASVKHFVCNNKETNRKESDSIVSERALREIYAKAFEIIVKKANPWTIMSSYNILNGVKVSENKELLTDILRDEWGYEGLVTSDWWNHSEQYLEIKAGNDIKMMNGYAERVKTAYEQGLISKEEIQTSARRILEMILKQD